MTNGDDFYPSVAPIGQSDTGAKAPDIDPNYSNLGAPHKQEDSGESGKGATQDDITKHVYEINRRNEEHYNEQVKAYSGMQNRIRELGQEEEALSRERPPQEIAYPELPDTERRSVALAHMMIGIPAAIFGGNKYNPGGALHGLSDLWNEFKRSGSKAQISERLALYREQVSIVHDQNVERARQYHEIMADRRADIHTKLEVINDLANLYKDRATADKAAADNWPDFQKYMEGVERMNDDHEEKVIGTLEKLHHAFGDSEAEQLWKSDGEKQFPELFDGLNSVNPREYAKAYNELRKKLPYYEWWKLNRERLHGTKTEAEIEQEQKLGQKGQPPPDTPSDDMKKKIQDMDPSLLFGTPKVEDKKQEDRRSKSEKYGYNPRRPFDKPQTTSDE